ncbi:methyltransferase domain-containing protein [Maritimibacter sp. UBA3975]|uniref:methyltransferase domain-containing protein n=1 Tax=Maritimibacter sp. UBA3975 TaxID=1946833 RepID=UPI000C08FC2A|nr:methyltransferase domain-containing protein [Maritimibacter sp. UBA3975]MAM60996.1 trans-aconitate methyltransferase [Maritimibacter sp.]|tara:strand:+ start:46004 stop:46792 length:789 start_codon:yes stop_codon:yes gene_type:complete
MTTADWDPEAYQRFRGLRLRPALELLAQVRDLPEGPIVDMGCGAGAVAEALSTRYPTRELFGVDNSGTMLDEADATGLYDRLTRDDATDWTPGYTPALIFSNALANWLPDHAGLFAHWAAMLPERGALAVQMPRQYDEPSHKLLRDLAEDMFPDRFDFADWAPPVAPPQDYAAMLDPLGDVRAWETTYVQDLAPVAGSHPVRQFTRSTVMRPFVAEMTETEAARYNSAYDALLARHYPARENGNVHFPFKRVFFVLTKHQQT